MASNFICFKCDSKLPNLAGCGFIEDRVTQATSWEEGRSALQTPCSMPTSQCKVRGTPCWPTSCRLSDRTVHSRTRVGFWVKRVPVLSVLLQAGPFPTLLRPGNLPGLS